ncbi:hypothetical protein FRB95_013007 [Tulasnella sp. JGI-2019a]|nr:hypothetical protein FRB95_013007 [Tulasnella sp. JGI-2019a]
MKAVTAILDFIYLAQYKSIDAADLSHMDTALATFHKHKDIFIKKGLHGTPDGYNTESPERLHIDFAKQAHCTSNKHNYTSQMTQWLSHQEAVAICVAYINWLYPENMEEEDSQDDEEVIETPSIGTSIETKGKGGGGEANLGMDLDDESDISDDSEEADTGAIIIECSIYNFTKTSPLPRLTGDVLSDHFGATNILPAVHSYLKSLGHARFKIPTIHDCFDVYKRVTVCLGMPGDPEALIVDLVWAFPSKGSGPLCQLGKQSHSDTVLV